MEWVKVDHPQEKRWNRYFSSGSSGGRLCAIGVIIISDIGAREYWDLGKWYIGLTFWMPEALSAKGTNLG